MNELPDQLDRFMQERLQDLQQDPPEMVWSNLSKELADGKKGKRKWAYILFPAAAAAIAVVSLYFISPELFHTGPSLAHKADVQRANPGVREIIAPVPDDNNIYLSGENDTHGINQQNLPQRSLQHKENTAVDGSQKSTNPVFNVYNSSDDHLQLSMETPANAQNTAANNANSSDIKTIREDFLIGIMNPLKNLETNSELCKNLDLSYSSLQKKLSKGGHYTRLPDLYAGLKYTPSLQMGSGQSSFVQGAALDLGLQYSHLIVQTGLGLEFVTQNSDYSLSWEEHQSKGSYQYVQSFSIDTVPIYLGDSLIGYNYRPLFHTTSVELFDTVAVNQTASVPVKYTWVSIPLMLGYRINHRNFAFNLKAGASYTFACGGKKPTKALDDVVNGAAEQYLSDRIGPDPRKQWLSLIAAPEAEYYFNEHLSVSLEPWFRYTLSNANSTAGQETGKPYTLGLNTGIKVHL
jgi:hypothetical protein